MNKRYFALMVTTRQSGSHGTLFPQGTFNTRLVHDNDGEAATVEVCEVPEALNELLREKKAVHFSSTEDLYELIERYE